MEPPSFVRSLGPILLNEGGIEIPSSDVITDDSGYIGLYFAAEWAANSQATTEQLTRLLQEKNKSQIKLIFVSSDQDEDAFRRQLKGMSVPAIPFSDIRRRLRLLRQYRVSNLPFLVILNKRTGRCISRVNGDTLLKDPECTKFPWKTRSLKEILSKAEVVNPDGESVSYERLTRGLIGLYFSANWCPPCKAFTPQLIHSYNALQSKGHDFEILFVSSDRSEDSWKAYHNSMPWPSIRWSDSDTRTELAENLEVKGIPTLVILDSDLSVITREGRTFINEDPQGEGFPWRPQSVDNLRDFDMPSILERPTLVLFTDGDPGEIQFARDVLLPAAEEYYAEHSDEAGMSLKFFVAGEDEVSEGLRELANLDDVIPLLAIIDLAEGTKFLLEKGVEISNATVHNFVSRYTKDELAPIPIEENDVITDDEEGGKEEGEEDDIEDNGNGKSLLKEERETKKEEGKSCNVNETQLNS
ncbi:UNVERIFIED_CONTAM: hypothetical protein RMT77_000401 [Armadillidium vulgare]